MSLTLDYRPRRFADVVGQKHIRPVLRAMVRSGDVPPALLFSGTRGTGKTTAGRILAAALNCRESEDDACAECPSCKAVQAGTSLSVIEIDAASNGLVGDIRKIRDMVAYSHEGEWRVVLLDEAHSMSKEAFNALLKVLEEPPPGTVFVLLTTEADKILETVRSRTMWFEFRRLTEEDIVGRLRHIAVEESIEADDSLLVEIAHRAQGGLRDAVMLLDQCRRVGASEAEGFRSLFGLEDSAIELLRAAADGNLAEGLRLVDEHFYRAGDASGLVADLVDLTSDLLRVRSGGAPRRNTDDRKALASRLSVEQLVAVMRLLWDLRSKTRHVANDQWASMQMAFVLLADALGKRGEVPIQRQEATAAPQRRLSLAEMQAAMTAGGK